MKCANCAIVAEQEFCPVCGQSTRVHRGTLLQVARDALGDFWAFDSKVFRSFLPLLFQPGFLTVEYLAGKRARYISPVRLYVFVTLIFFWLATPILDIQGISFTFAETSSEGVTKEQAVLALQSLVEALPNFLVLGIPLISVLLYVMHRKPKHLLYDHLIFSLHNHAFFFVFAFLLGVLPDWLAGAIAVPVPLVYMVLAMKRVYRRSWAQSVVKSLVLGLSYPLVVLGALVGAASMALSESGIELP